MILSHDHKETRLFQPEPLYQHLSSPYSINTILFIDFVDLLLFFLTSIFANQLASSAILENVHGQQQAAVLQKVFFTVFSRKIFPN